MMMFHDEVFDGEEEDHDDNKWSAYDDVKGKPLDPGLVRQARLKEIKILHERKMYEYASTSQAIQRCGRKPLRLKWVDTDKGGNNIRSRLVCTEVRRPGMEAIFAPTPPLDSMRIIISKAAERRGRTGKNLTLQLIDVSRAHFYAPSVREVYIQLPQGDPMNMKLMRSWGVIITGFS